MALEAKTLYSLSDTVLLSERKIKSPALFILYVFRTTQLNLLVNKKLAIYVLAQFHLSHTRMSNHDQKII